MILISKFNFLLAFSIHNFNKTKLSLVISKAQSESWEKNPEIFVIPGKCDDPKLPLLHSSKLSLNITGRQHYDRRQEQRIKNLRHL